MSYYQTLVEALETAAKTSRSGQGYTFLEGTTEIYLSFDQLWQQARRYAGALQHRGVQKGDRVLLTLPTSVEFAGVYLGLLLCGAVPCVLPSPEGMHNQAEGMRRISSVADQLSATLLVAPEETAKSLPANENPFQVCSAADLETDNSYLWQPVSIKGNDLALIQASSGTTGAPKCVALSHSNILANVHQIGQRLHVVSDDVVVCWLPLFHDMGLIGCFLFVLYWQLHGVFMTPYRFLRRPATWLKAISEFGGTLSPAPNFAYALAAHRITEKEASTLDLSSWRGVLCGAEQIDIGTLQGFSHRFEACGFRASSLVPCYGMAEASLCVSMHQPGEMFNYERITRSVLAKDGQAVLTDETDSSAATLVCDCGQPVDGTSVRIVDEEGADLPDGHVGQIWISGPSISQGYFGSAELNTQLFQDGWLKTGDLGYMRAGHLFVTGRSKDLIVIRGHNYQPTDFEWAAAEISGLSRGRVVAFGTFDPVEATEQLYIVCESPRKAKPQDQELAQLIKLHVGRSTGVLPAHIGFVARNTIPKTTSGKVQRARVKSLYFKFNSSITKQA